MAGTGDAALRSDTEAATDIVLRVLDLVVEFPAGRNKVVHAVSGISFDVARGETLGIVGESGCGKTTTGRAVMQLEDSEAGTIEVNGSDLAQLKGRSLRHARRPMQMIFQDPVSSLNPSRRVRDLIREGLTTWGTAESSLEDGWVDSIMESVGLGGADMGERRPHEFSGGQCQRICIARSLVMDPDILILDEPVSALDVSVQAQILNLLESLKDQFGLTMLFISHDLAVVKNVSDRVMVMYLGKVCEIADTESLYQTPTHPYTRALLASIPGQELGLPPASELISGELPSPLDPPSGCRFRTRCPQAMERCAVEEPILRQVAPGHHVACHLHPATDSYDSASTGDS